MDQQTQAVRNSRFNLVLMHHYKVHWSLQVLSAAFGPVINDFLCSFHWMFDPNRRHFPGGVSLAQWIQTDNGYFVRLFVPAKNISWHPTTGFVIASTFFNWDSALVKNTDAALIEFALHQLEMCSWNILYKHVTILHLQNYNLEQKEQIKTLKIIWICVLRWGICTFLAALEYTDIPCTHTIW